MTAGARHDDSVDFQGHRAGIVSRGVAAIIDTVVVSAFALFAEFGIGVTRSVVLGPPLRLPDLSPGLGTTFWCAIAVVSLTWGWMTAGRTAGDQLMGLRVMSRSGRRLGLPRALLRAVLCATFPVGLVWVPVSRRNASVQDLIVRSVVIYDWYYEPVANGAHRRSSTTTGATPANLGPGMPE
jgi:uncharacterized RDD family membrane protein YckC